MWGSAFSKTNTLAKSKMCSQCKKTSWDWIEEIWLWYILKKKKYNYFMAPWYLCTNSPDEVLHEPVWEQPWTWKNGQEWVKSWKIGFFFGVWPFNSTWLIFNKLRVAQSVTFLLWPETLVFTFWNNAWILVKTGKKGEDLLIELRHSRGEGHLILFMANQELTSSTEGELVLVLLSEMNRPLEGFSIPPLLYFFIST